MNQSDEQLVIDYLNGNKTVFTDIVNRYLKPIYNFIYRLVGNNKEAEDISQEVFLKVWKNIKKFDTEKSFKTWIFSIAKNTAIDHLRKRKDIPISVFDDESGGNFIEDNLKDEELKADEIFALAQDKQHIEKVLTELSIIQKEIITLKYVNEISLSEIAEIMDLSINTAKSHHRRALLKMREKMKTHPNYQDKRINK